MFKAFPNSRELCDREMKANYDHIGVQVFYFIAGLITKLLARMKRAAKIAATRIRTWVTTATTWGPNH